MVITTYMASMAMVSCTLALITDGWGTGVTEAHERSYAFERV